jgi:hypothetical protein
MNGGRPKDLAWMSERFTHCAFRNIRLRNATVLGIQQHNAHTLLVKPLHIEVSPVDCLGAILGEQSANAIFQMCDLSSSIAVCWRNPRLAVFS